jgi:hypothetical protein
MEKPFSVTIEFTPQGQTAARVSGTVRTDDGFVQSFSGDAELHAAIDIVTEREIRDICGDAVSPTCPAGRS